MERERCSSNLLTDIYSVRSTGPVVQLRRERVRAGGNGARRSVTEVLMGVFWLRLLPMRRVNL